MWHYININLYYTPVLERTTNTESVSAVQYFVRSWPPLTRRECRHRYPVHSPVQDINKRRSRPRGQLYSPFLAYFRVVLCYFQVNSTKKSYRKAIINYLRKSWAKISENRRELVGFGCFQFKCQQGQYGLIRPTLLTSSRQVIFRFYLLIKGYNKSKTR